MRDESIARYARGSGRMAVPCEWCGDHFLVWPSRSERKYCRWACAVAARTRTGKPPVRQACPVCGVFFFASWWVVARGRGRYCSRACTPTSYPKPRRDGDRKQARERIGYLVRKGTLPPARTLACTDCGLPAADYDHFLGYGAAHHEKVQPVCRKCHTQRGIARGENRPPAVTPTTGPCRICGSDKGPFRHRRCNACRLYLTYHGHDRIIAS